MCMSQLRSTAACSSRHSCHRSGTGWTHTRCAQRDMCTRLDKQSSADLARPMGWCSARTARSRRKLAWLVSTHKADKRSRPRWFHKCLRTSVGRTRTRMCLSQARLPWCSRYTHHRSGTVMTSMARGPHAAALLQARSRRQPRCIPCLGHSARVECRWRCIPCHQHSARSRHHTRYRRARAPQAQHGSLPAVR